MKRTSRELFKVKADFDTSMSVRLNIPVNMPVLPPMLCKAEKLKHLDASALARLVEHGSRLADDQEKLSTHFGEIADVIREASYYAGLDGVELISGSTSAKPSKNAITAPT